jgi:hypothetical protein
MGGPPYWYFVSYESDLQRSLSVSDVERRIAESRRTLSDRRCSGRLPRIAGSRARLARPGRSC